MSAYTEHSIGLSESVQDLLQSICVISSDDELSPTAMDTSLTFTNTSPSNISQKSQFDSTPFDLIEEDQLVPGTKRSQHLSPDFSIFLSNGYQLTIKLQELMSLSYQKDYDLVLLTEVCPMNPRTRLEDYHINMPGYQVVPNLSCTGCKSSVLALIKNTHAVYGLSSETNSAPAESIWFDFTVKTSTNALSELVVPIEACFHSQQLRLTTLSLMFHPAIENFTDDFIIEGDFNLSELI